MRGLGPPKRRFNGATSRFRLRRHAQPLCVRWPEQDQKQRRAPQSVHARYRHSRPRSWNSSRHRPAAERQRHRTNADARHELPLCLRRRAAPAGTRQQYYEIFGNRAMYKDGWIACAPASTVRRGKWTPSRLRSLHRQRLEPRRTNKWELYHIDTDFPKRNDLAAQHPEKLAELKQLFWEEPPSITSRRMLGGFASIFCFSSRRRPIARSSVLSRYDGHLSGMIPAHLQSHDSASRRRRSPRGGEGVIVAEADMMGGLRVVRAGRQVALHLQPRRAEDRHGHLDRATSAGQDNGPLQPSRPTTPAKGNRRPRANSSRRQGRAETKLMHGVPLRFSMLLWAWTSVATTATSSRRRITTKRRSPSPARSAPSHVRNRAGEKINAAYR